MDLTSILTVGFVWFLIFWLSLSYGSLYLGGLYEQNLCVFCIITPALLFCLGIGCYSYFQAIWTSPGYPQQNLVVFLQYQKLHYSQSIEDMKRRCAQQKQFKKLRNNQQLTHDIKLREINCLVQNSYCEKCDNAKLARVHHCKLCRKCIERMDHHCPWVGNCIGKHNHKYFYLFLLYITIALTIVSFTLIADYISAEKPILTRIQKQDNLYYILILVTAAMCILLLLSIGYLWIGQTILIFQNLTTLQSFYDGIFHHNPFEKQTVKDHIKQIFGDSIWLIPTNPFPGFNQKNVAFLN